MHLQPASLPSLTEIPVLDKGFVRLVDYSGTDLSVVRAARVSHNAPWREAEDETSPSDAKLINYLMKNRHTSPFEAVTFTFEVKAPIFIYRQWHRHRTWSFNEVSARYTELDMGFYVPDCKDITMQAKSNKQARTSEEHPHAQILQNVIRQQSQEAFDIYKSMLADGCARELARMVLPVNTYSRMFATVDLHNLFHFIHLRLHPHAQREIQWYASALLALVEQVVPVCVKSYRDVFGVYDP